MFDFFQADIRSNSICYGAETRCAGDSEEVRIYVPYIFTSSHWSSIFRYKLWGYTIENKQNKRECKIEIPKEKFAEWLTEYREEVVRRDSENAEEGDDEGWNNVYY